jgi:hypothetical protein
VFAVSFRRTTTALTLTLLWASLVCGVAGASTNAVSRVRDVYRSVLDAEYFGPSSAVCSRLTASGVKSFTAGGQGTCRRAFDAEQHVLRHKMRGVDDSGFTARQWRQEVSQVMGTLKITVHGTHASAIGPSGIPGRTTLVEISGTWFFSSYPPSIQS